MDWLSGSKHGQAKKLIAQLADGTKRDQAARELIGMGADAVLPLIDALQTQDLNLLLTYQHILARIPSASPHLIKTLGTAHPLVRARVAEVFSLSKDKNAIPALMEAVKGEFFTVRSRAALALGNIGDARVVPVLFPLLKDNDDEVRIAACVAIGKFRDPSTFDEITNVLLDDPKIEVRQAAAKVLGETKHPAAIPFLMEALRDSFWWYEKEQSAQVLLDAIESMGSAIVVPLIEALGDREVTVRKYAAMVLGNLRDARAIEELGMAVYDLHHEVSQAAAEALAKFGAPAIGLLSEALRHPEAAVREHAVIGLGKIQDAHVVPLLIEMLHDSDRVVKKQAILSLTEFKDPRADLPLREIANDRADRELAMLAKQLIENKK
ncbi:MAG: HEAT repeat domain-containing protein [Anaerolineales bacterium]|nr:HEAT repeat domain-containing protein [Anaerolineales bacterium]